jgi:hypothetical protein
MISWIKSLCRRAPAAKPGQSGPQQTTRVDELLADRGKAHTEALINFATSVSEAQFIDTVSCSSLVGAAIRGGKIEEAARLRSGTNSFETFAFSQEQISGMIKGATIEQSIFLLRKGPGGKRATSYTEFSIGRAKDSDIRIVDFALSRNHALIEIQGDGYAIRDCNSRNGTRLNGVKISTGNYTLKDGDVITLGRYDFTFLTPKSLYARLHKKQG